VAKTNSSFKFGKMNKIQLGNILDPEARAIYKKAMIDAELSYTIGKTRKFSDPASAQKNSRPTIPGSGPATE